VHLVHLSFEAGILEAPVGCRPLGVVGADAAVGGVEAEDALQVLLGKAIGDEYATVGNCRAGVARADRRRPDAGEFASWKFLDDARLAPNDVALRPAPLRPVVSPQRRGGRSE
jgi:hypothetical protein